MRTLFIVWICILALLATITFTLKGESTHFYGIADTTEVVVSSENPVEVKKIHVLQGQEIHTGDTLVELNRPELIMKISEITHEYNEMKAQKQQNVTLSRSQIRQLKAEQEATVNEIKSEIEQLEAQYELNKKLASDLQSVKKESNKSSTFGKNNPIKIKIESLKKDLKLALNPSQIEIDNLRSGLSSTQDPVLFQMQRYESELALLLEEKRKLIKFAQINGVIGSVNFKEGERVSPFAPIITLHTKSPLYIKGYIHENVYNKIAILQKVDVHSITDRSNRIEGEVVGVGSRIVEYPMRLRKRQEIQIWGREIVIKIPPENRFLLGEKVLITSTKL